MKHMSLGVYQENVIQSTAKSWSYTLSAVIVVVILTIQFLTSEIFPYFHTMRIVMTLVTPMLVMITFFLLSSYLLNIDISNPIVKTTLLFTFILAIFGIFFALTINTRSFLLVVSLLGANVLDIDQAQFLLIAILAPLIEEFVKIYPAILFSVHFSEIKGRKVRYISKPQMFLFLAVIGGAVFNMLETYWYSWQVASLDDIASSASWNEINLQIIIRSLNPLHISSALISAVGIIIAFQMSSRAVFTRDEFSIFIPYFIGGVLLHGLWNGSLLIFQGQEFLYSLPMLNILLIPTSLTIWILILIRYRNVSPDVCPICNQWHLTQIVHENDIDLKSGILSGLPTSGDKVFRCRNCNFVKPGKNCTNCSSTEVFACAHCKYPLPIFAEICWKCKRPVQTIFDNLMLGDDHSVNRFYRGMYYFFSLTYVLQLLLNIAQFTTRTSDISSLPTSLVLFFIISTALMAGIYLNTSEAYLQWGLIMSRYIFGLIFLLIGILLIAVGIFFYSFSPLSGLFLIVISPVYFYIFLRVIYPQKIFMEACI